MTTSSFSSRFFRTLGQLALALLNATLVLVALCLFLGLNLTNRIDNLTATFAQNLIEVEPLREELAQTREQIAGLRSDLADMIAQTDTLSAAASARLQGQMTELNARLDAMSAPFEKLSGAPERIIDQAVQSLADEAAMTYARIRGCTPADRAAVNAAITAPTG